MIYLQKHVIETVRYAHSWTILRYRLATLLSVLAALYRLQNRFVCVSSESQRVSQRVSDFFSQQNELILNARVYTGPSLPPIFTEPDIKVRSDEMWLPLSL